MTRQKTVYTNTDTIAHLWANQLQDNARTPTNHFYFNNKIIYSYGSHFPIANLYNDNVILFTYRGYSNTTSKHIWSVKGALSAEQTAKIIYCNNPKPWLSNKLDVLTYAINETIDFIRQLRPQREKIAKARKPENYIPSFLADVANVEKFKKFIANELKKAPKIDEAWFNDRLKSNKKELARHYKELSKFCTIENIDTLREQIKARELVSRQKEEARLKAQIRDFKNFEHNANYIQGELTYLRVIKESKTVQTSRNVKFDEVESKQLYLAFKAKRLLGQEIQRFKITNVDYTKQLVTAGCHVIPFAEIESAAKELGFTN